MLSGLQRTIDESDVFQAEADKAVLPEQTMDEAVESFPDSFQPLDDSVDPSVRELPAQQVKMLLEQHIDDAEKNLGTHCSLRFRFAEFFSGCLLNYSRSILC